MLTREQLKEVIKYDPNTGSFIWKVDGHKRVKGKEAGSVDYLGYRRIGIDGEIYHAGPLAWFYMTGSWPKECIDHIDHDPSNNRLSNLREATFNENMYNTRTRKDNPTGVKGVGRSANGTKWIANISYDGTRHYLGTFKTLKEAAKARKAAEIKHHREFRVKA